uniref:Serine palmitoyltransferase small subunit B n=1 Tax=Dromaius novaehollandiae TaxID=8790 RepID=A0A8C4JXE2_DRONO
GTPMADPRLWKKNMKNYLYWLYCQFELITCVCLMEPWEKLLFYSFNIALLVVIIYTAHLFIPAHIIAKQLVQEP